MFLDHFGDVGDRGVTRRHRASSKLIIDEVLEILLEVFKLVGLCNRRVLSGLLNTCKATLNPREIVADVTDPVGGGCQRSSRSQCARPSWATTSSESAKSTTLSVKHCASHVRLSSNSKIAVSLAMAPGA